MTIWLLVILGTAAGGALVLWHGVSRTKHTSDLMLKTYSEMLTEARNKRQAQIARQRLAEAAEDTQPTD
jgi:hypothetical protein